MLLLLQSRLQGMWWSALSRPSPHGVGRIADAVGLSLLTRRSPVEGFSKMVAYQVVFRNQRCRIRRIIVLGKTDTGFRTAGPVALWPSGKNTFLRLKDAKAYLQAAGDLAGGDGRRAHLHSAVPH